MNIRRIDRRDLDSVHDQILVKMTRNYKTTELHIHFLLLCGPKKDLKKSLYSRYFSKENNAWKKGATEIEKKTS